MILLCSQRGAYQKSSVAMRGIVITENQRSVHMVVIHVLLKKRTTKKEVTKVFQYNSQLTVIEFSLFLTQKLYHYYTEMVKVYDGNNSLRRRIFRVISVPRQATTEQFLTSALRAFHITKDPST